MPRKKASKTTTAKKASKKVDELNQTHGKVEESKDKKPTTLDQLWGDTGMSRYKTLDASQYEGYLKNLNKSDLQRHAAEMGIVPVDNREMLSNRLLKEFKRYVASYKIPTTQQSNHELSAEAKRILAEGR